jgi:hypothetical protein
MAEQHSPNDQRIRQIVREEIQANNGVIMETMRDMQTELLRGMERFARGNFSHRQRPERLTSSRNASPRSKQSRRASSPQLFLVASSP